MRIAQTWALAALLAGGTSRLPAQQEASSTAAAIGDVVGALKALPASSRPLVVSAGGAGAPEGTRGGHLQGVQMQLDAATGRQVAYLSHDSDSVAYLLSVEFSAGLEQAGRVTHVRLLPSDVQSPPLRHAGGMQLAGDVLAVGLEDNQQKTRSEIQFWDVARVGEPAQLGHLTIRRAGAPKEKTAGAVALAARAGDHVLAVANWDSRAIDFYVSNGRPLADHGCRFEPVASWRVEAADKRDWQPDAAVGSYQAMHLLADAGKNLFLFGFATSPAGKDFVDLFAVDLRQEPSKILRKLARKSVALEDKNHFSYAAGLWIDGGRMAILASPSELAGETRLSIVRPAP